MPSKNSIKRYSENGYYHIYNRGVAKGEIFLSDQDYAVFLSYLKEYLLPPVPPTVEELMLMRYKYNRKNYHDSIDLICFCLMPNHFHLLLKQNEPRNIEGFMRSLSIRYAGYFNKHYERVGHVFQDVYTCTMIEQDEYLWWLSRYIHRNPLNIIKPGSGLANYLYSSYSTFLGQNSAKWINSAMILGVIKDYKSFVEDDKNRYPEKMVDLILDTDSN